MFDIKIFSKAGLKGENQDAVLGCTLEDYTLIAVADGLGGKEAGAEASRIAIESLKREFEINCLMDFSISFRIIKEDIGKFAIDNNIKEMGTTLTACLLNKDIATVAHVGDTRLYHLRNDGIISITKDQTEVQKLLDDGILTRKRAKKYHRKNVLLSALTNYSDYSLFQTEFYISQNDRIVLVSDGTYELVKKIELRNISIKQKNVSNFVDDVLTLIESRKIRDDYTLLACDIG